MLKKGRWCFLWELLRVDYLYLNPRREIDRCLMKHPYGQRGGRRSQFLLDKDETGSEEHA